MAKVILFLFPLLLVAPLTVSPAAACENCTCDGMVGGQMSGILKQALQSVAGADPSPILKPPGKARVIRSQTRAGELAEKVRRLLPIHQPMFMVSPWQ
jgi:hypothetical protein